ncbi:hypothetical protein ACFVH6_14565 [Spirillospora sp. NPDC127200]
MLGTAERGDDHGEHRIGGPGDRRTDDHQGTTRDSERGVAVNESGPGAAAPMSREGVDHALDGLRDERDRIAAALLDLDRHDGFRLLNGAGLTGETRRRWDEARARVALLWRLFEAYRQVLDTAAELRARHSRPDLAVLTELTGLLAGASVEVPGGEIPLGERTLLGPHRERVTLDEAVAVMSECYERTAEVVAAADAAWTALLVPLEGAEEGWRATARLAQRLDGTRRPELDRLGRELTALGRMVRTDPLSLVRDGRADAARLDRLRAAIEALREELAEAVRLRDSYAEQAARLEAAIAEVGELEERARAVRADVLVKIDSPGPPEPPPLTAALRERLAALAGPREGGRWTELAGRVAELERAAEAARERLAEHLRLTQGLLDRRAELRGRLEAYRAKAARLGLAEDDRLTRLHGQARDLLWTAPCDLRRATAAVADYQRAIKACENGTGTRR